MARPELDEARAVVVRLSKLGGGPDVLRLAAARTLAALPLTGATELLENALELAGEGFEPARRVMMAFLRALEFDVELIPNAGSLRQVAVLHGQTNVELLFAEGEPQRQYDLRAAARADAKLFNMPLGYLKTQARLTTNPDQLSRLATVSNPVVIREVLRNGRLTEALVVRIAARRPARPEPLVEIWRSARWSVRPAIRRALVFNPYLPPEVGAKIIPLMSREDWALLSEDMSLHASLREQARALLAKAP